MSTINTSLAAPSLVFMNASLSQIDEVIIGGAGGTYGVYENGDTGFYIGWESKYKTYQVRWCKRQRKTPTASVEGAWGGWGAWQGANTCSTKTARSTLVTPSNTQDWDTWNMANARPSSSTNLFAANQYCYTHYVRISATALGTYDMEQWKVQVRPYDEGAKKHGNTKTITFSIIHAPASFSVTAVKLATNDSLRVYYTTDWNRDGNSVTVIWPNNSGCEIGDVRGGLTGTYFTIPISKLNKDYDIGSAFSAMFDLNNVQDAGGGGGAYKRTTFSGSVESIYGTPVTAPTVTPTPDSDAHVMTVVVTGGSGGYPWTGASLKATWTNPDGTTGSAKPSKVVSEDYNAKTGTYEFSDVPSDIPVKYTAQITSVAADSDKASKGSAIETLRSLGRTYLTIGGKIAALVCALEEAGVTWTRSYAPNVEHEVCAGRSREVSRHGTGGVASIQVKGDIVYDTDSHDMGSGNRLTDWETMKRYTGSDGSICLPQGIYAKVAVTGIDIDTARPAHSVTLSLEEVS